MISSSARMNCHCGSVYRGSGSRRIRFSASQNSPTPGSFANPAKNARHCFRCSFSSDVPEGKPLFTVTVLRSAGLLRSAINRNSQISRQAGRLAALAEGHDPSLLRRDRNDLCAGSDGFDYLRGFSVCELILRITYQREQFRRLCPVQRILDVRTDKRKVFFYGLRQRRFQPASETLLLRCVERIGTSQKVQPLVTLREHSRQQSASAAHIVVEMNKQTRDRITARPQIRKLIDDSLSRQFVKRLWVFRDLCHTAEQSLEGGSLRD